jgi:hypothetical protein
MQRHAALPGDAAIERDLTRPEMQFREERAGNIDIT